MSWLSKLFYSQSIFPFAARAVEFIAGTAVYAGSYLFGYLEAKYIKDFDSKHRQTVVPAGSNAEGSCAPDWENPEVVGRNRQKAHTVLRSFRSIEAARSYWTRGGADEERYCNKFLLTGTTGNPSTDKEWKFLLVGCPAAAPSGWWEHGESSEGWAGVALPAHWQCQGFDVPIYTNTVYPVIADVDVYLYFCNSSNCCLYCSFASTPLELAAMAPGLTTCATLGLGGLHPIQPRRPLMPLGKIRRAYIGVSFACRKTGPLKAVDIS